MPIGCKWFGETSARSISNACAPKPPSIEDYAKQTEVFDSVAAYANHSFNVSTGAEPERIRGAYVSANLFPMLEAQPSTGRVFTSDEHTSSCFERWVLATPLRG